MESVQTYLAIKCNMGGYRQCSTMIFNRFVSIRAKIDYFEHQNWDFLSPAHAKNDENPLDCYFLESVQTYLAIKCNMGGYRQCSTKIFSRFFSITAKIYLFEPQNWVFSSHVHAKNDENPLLLFLGVSTNLSSQKM